MCCRNVWRYLEKKVYLEEKRAFDGVRRTHRYAKHAWKGLHSMNVHFDFLVYLLIWQKVGF